jgi:UTP--glucose-1-phosphate uridylyltransferase
MNVRKAVITAAAPEQHTLPLQRLVDRDGVDKTALQLIVEEVVEAGVEEICVVIRPGDESAYEQAAGEHIGQIRFVAQDQPLGYGDALLRARQFVGDEAFLHLVGDHLYLSDTTRRCARQLIDVARDYESAVSAVQATRENKLPYFGVIGGTRVPQRADVYEVEHVVEKPTPTQAEQELIVAGLRSGYYLCFFGMHVLTPPVLEILAELAVKKRPTLSDALAILCQRQRHLAVELRGTRYNIGMRYGLLIAQLALALSGRDRDQVLTELVELLAVRREPDPEFPSSQEA